MEEKSITQNPEALLEDEKPKKPRTKKNAEAKAEKPEDSKDAETAETPAPDEAAEREPEEAYLGKFKSVDALMRAYRELEAEFTRRSQKLKVFEESAPLCGNAEEKRAPRDEELYDEVSRNEGVRARVVGDYLSSLKGVPLMTGGGAGVKAPADRPKSIREAGSLALGYLRNQKN